MNNLTIKETDEFIVATDSIISNFDRKIITKLYQPIISFGGFALYFSLLSELEFDKTVTSQNRSLCDFLKLMKMSLNEFITYKNLLEMFGLLKTFKHKKDNYFVFQLYSPLTPKNFFNHLILEQKFLKAVGNEEYERTKQYFTSAHLPINDLVDISTDFDDRTINNTSDRLIDSNNNSIKISFDFDAFYSQLEEFQVPKKNIPAEIINNLPYLSKVYNVSAVDLASICFRCGIKGKYDFNEIKKACEQRKTNSLFDKKHQLTNDRNVDQMIALYDSNSPLEFMALLFDGIPVTKAEEDTIYSLMANYGLSFSFMNAILDFMFNKIGTFNKKYLEQVCVSIARKKLKTSLDVYKALRGGNSSDNNAATSIENENLDEVIKKNLEELSKKKKEFKDGNN